MIAGQCGWRIGGLALLALMGTAKSDHAFWLQAFPGFGETVWQDTAKPGTPRGGYRVAYSGGVYLANGRSLVIWDSALGFADGRSRKFTPSEVGQAYPFQEPAPLAAASDANPLVLWGNWRSRDR